MWRRFTDPLILGAFALLTIWASIQAIAQTPMGIYTGQVWSATQWNNWSATKQDFPIPVAPPLDVDPITGEISCPTCGAPPLATTSSPGIVTPDGRTITICGAAATICANVVFNLVSYTTNHNILATETGTWFDNNGASAEVDFTLPIVAAPITTSLRACFTVSTAQVLKVIAPSASGSIPAAQIALGTSNSNLGGYVYSYQPWSSLCVHTTTGPLPQWVADYSPSGDWYPDH